MPSFDIVSEIDSHELSNAVDQANREIDTRFDFKGTNAKFKLDKDTITLTAPSKFQVEQMFDILQTKMTKRQIDIQCLEKGDLQEALNETKQLVKVQQGIDQPMAKKLVKVIKDSKLKVQAAIQGEQVRVTGKKRDDLQDAIALLKEAEMGLPLQYVNFRD